MQLLQVSQQMNVEASVSSKKTLSYINQNQISTGVKPGGRRMAKVRLQSTAQSRYRLRRQEMP